jgi:hypothetical protein
MGGQKANSQQSNYGLCFDRAYREPSPKGSLLTLPPALDIPAAMFGEPQKPILPHPRSVNKWAGQKTNCLSVFAVSMNKTTRTLSKSAQQKLEAYHWPGNVRELRNVVERALILVTTPEIQPGSLPDFQLEACLHKTAATKSTPNGSLDEMIAQYEKELIGNLLEQHHFSLAKTAEHLKTSRHALRYRMQRLNIARGADGEEETQA